MLGNRHSSEQILWKLLEVEVTLSRAETVAQTDNSNRTGFVRRSHKNQLPIRSNGNEQITDTMNVSSVVSSCNTKSNGSTCHAH